jgi:hypothetical protein
LGATVRQQTVAKNLVLLTGPPECGKTAVILRLIERLGELWLAGFYTQEQRERGQGVGFEAVVRRPPDDEQAGRHPLRSSVSRQVPARRRTPRRSRPLASSN